jgi:Fur family transcriptional regulator, iron response regulator
MRQLLSSGFRPVLRPEAEMLLRLRSPNDNAAKLRTKLREAGLRPTRTRVALSELLFSQGDRHVTAERLFEEANQARVSVYIEDRHELMDIPPTNVIIGKAPVPPDGYEIARIDVVVRLRRKVDSQLRPCL